MPMPFPHDQVAVSTRRPAVVRRVSLPRLGWVDVAHLNRGTPRLSDREYYDEELRSAIETLYQADLELFQYSF